MVVQEDLNLLNNWQKKWLLSYTRDNKCNVLQVKQNRRQIFNQYLLDNAILPVIECERDLDVNNVNDLSWDYHISESINKAKKCIDRVSRSVISRDPNVMLNIYKTLIRPHLENCVQLWNPIPKHGNWGTILELESVKRKFTRLIDGIGLETYRCRLNKLKLTTLI